MKTAKEIKAEIDDLKQRRFYEEMADFMNWTAYRELSDRIEILEQKLKKCGDDTCIHNEDGFCMTPDCPYED